MSLDYETRDFLTMIVDYDRFHGTLKFQLLAEVVIVIVTSHSPVVSCLLCK